MASPLPLACLIVLSLWAINEVSGANVSPSDCCLRVKNKVIPRQNVKHFFLQDESSGCSIKAVVLVTRRNRHLCVPHHVEWVKNIMEDVQRRRARKKRHNQSCEIRSA
ncbi:C-C motif chemokine 19-like [Spea bombifrons]|uniref:C-C motif chemokine 19-like n=1 Tax=Spea bombifrons TaxID=233779 RepID=UPI002348F26C|nr:C-C motif chemokine 19-like [Spea bombifrons]